MAYYLLDTDAVIDCLGGVATSVSLIKDLDGRGESLCVCAVVIAEVHSGLRAADRDTADAFLGMWVFLSTGPDEARQAGWWRYDYARRGIALSTTEVLVAATARAHRATIVTGNVAHYPMGEVAVLPLPRRTP